MLVFNSVRETREWVNVGTIRMNVEMKEQDFFTIYDDLSFEVAKDIVKQYLEYRGDDGRAQDIQIYHDSNSHMVNISATLHYLGNDHTDYKHSPSHLRPRLY